MILNLKLLALIYPKKLDNRFYEIEDNLQNESHQIKIL